jgi:hypothetical protein
MSGQPDTRTSSVTPATVANLVEGMAKAGLINLKVDLATVVGTLRGVTFTDPGDLICYDHYVYFRRIPSLEQELVSRLGREMVTLRERDGAYQEQQAYQKQQAPAR